ncbi:MAG: thiol oxidoreductase [Nitrosomonas sp.]|nr:MAG: thiol oxidoreductase [Nitrosomonas sp.]
MNRKYRSIGFCILFTTPIVFSSAISLASENKTQPEPVTTIGKEQAIHHHLKDGTEFTITMHELIKHGKKLFRANWTIEEGGGRPLTKGTGEALSDPTSPLHFPRNFNRLSAPDSNSCAGCHNKPRTGGGGDIVTNVFITGERFDFVTFDHNDSVPLRGAVDEEGKFIHLDNFANFRNTLGLFGSGYIEMLSRQMTAELRKIRDSISAGSSAKLESKGISFGTLTRDNDGRWDTSQVTGLLASSLASDSPDNPPSLVIKPFHQAGGKVSLREFTNTAFNQHHGIQSTERFGAGVDSDGDGFVDELTRADITAATLFQAQLAVPGRVIPNNPAIEAAVLQGEQVFQTIGCASCHIPKLPLDNKGWIFTEPNPYNPEGNLQLGQVHEYKMDLTDQTLDNPRLAVENDTVWVPAFTDLKLHDITGGPSDPNTEPVDQNASGPAFFNGNSRFITRKLWGVANEPPYFHHGKFTTIRQAIEAHRGEAMDSYNNWTSLSEGEKDTVIEFLKTLKILPKDSKYLVVDEHGRKKHWPPKP